MKKTLLIISGFITISACAQTAVNSGAVSTNSLIHSVGELYVIPQNPNQATSGSIGAVSRIQFLVLDTDTFTASKSITLYPNPTANVLYFETGNIVLNTIEVFDLSGKVVLSTAIKNNSVDLQGLQSGTYVVTINGNSSQSFKIIRK